LNESGEGGEDLLAEVTALLYGDGTYMMGFSSGIQDAEAVANARFSDKPFCVVRAWRIIDVDVEPAYARALNAAGLEPVILFAEDVLIHSAGKRAKGDWVRTTFQRSFTEGFLFETQNTLYVLCGDGLRLSGTARAVLAMRG